VEQAKDIRRTTLGEVQQTLGTRLPEQIPGGKTRGFIDTIRRSAKTTQPVLERIEGQYVPRSTDDLSIKAATLVRENITAARDLARYGKGDEAVATASELIKHYQQVGDFDNAITVVNEIAPKLTELGRGVQAASIYNRLTPAGVLRFAQSEILKARSLAPRITIPDITAAKAKSIIDQARRIQQMPEGRARGLATQKLLEEISRLVPTPGWQKAIAIWKAGLLTGIKTTGVNTLGNVMMGLSEVIKDVPASIIDSLISIFTNKSSKAFTVRGLGKGLLEGTAKGWDYLRSGYDESAQIAAKYDFRKVNFSTKFGRGLQAYEEGIFRLIGAEDQSFYYAAKTRSLFDQAIAASRNAGLTGKEAKKFIEDFVGQPSQDVLEVATRDAAIAVFRNETALNNAVKGLGSSPFGELFAPFRRTPSAIATSLINYTPVGIVKTIIDNARKGHFDQRLFSEGLGRGITGTGILAIGAELSRRNLITTAPPASERERNQWEVEGKQRNSIYFNGAWHQAQAFGIPGMLLVAGAYYQEKLKETGSPTLAMNNALSGLGNIVVNQSMLQGVSRALNAITDPTRFGASLVEQTVGSVIPTLIGDIARATDPLQRERGEGIQGVVGAVQERIPGARQGLEPRRDVLEQPLPRPDTAVGTLINPLRSSRARITSEGELYGQVTQALKQTKQEREAREKEATGLIQQWKQLPKAEVNRLYNEVKKTNPQLAEEIKGQVTAEKLGLSTTEKEIKKLGVEDGMRARAIVTQLNKLKSTEEKRAYVKRLKEAKIITDTVARQIKKLLGGTP